MALLLSNSLFTARLVGDTQNFVDSNMDGSLKSQLMLHIVGRILIAGVAVAATIETIVHVAGSIFCKLAYFLSFYQMKSLNQKAESFYENAREGYIITAFSIASILLPTLFRRISNPLRRLY